MDLSHKGSCVAKDESSCSSFALTLLSPAKINLFFNILGKREDGYHEILSRYQAITLFDSLSFKHSTAFNFTSDGLALACDENNLITKAVHLFRKEVGVETPVAIHLSKKIPMQAGLGGGSSNAATTLFALNILTQARLSDQDLAILSAPLGSDVPFFFSLGTALCSGRGEKIAPEPFIDTLGPITIVKPLIGLSTPYVYSLVKPLKQWQRSFTTSSLSFYNDLEDAAFTALPALKELKRELLSCGFSHVLLSGSGTAFFCLGKALATLPSSCKIFIVNAARRYHGSWYTP